VHLNTNQIHAAEEHMTTNRIDIVANGRRVTGIATGQGPSDAPLVVALHGGSYNARYFDVPGLSLLDLAAATGFPAVALDRPGYGGSDPLPEGEVSFAGNAEALDEVIARLWADRGDGHSGVVIISHSMGSAITVHLAARRPQWPLLGIAVHGVNDLSPEPVINAMRSLPAGQPVVFTAEQRRMLMYGPDATMDADAITRAEPSTAPMPLAELLEMVGEWPASAAKLAAGVSVPVHYALAEFDALWVVDQNRVDTFAGYFSSAPWVNATLFRGSGHNIDHHHLGRTLHLQQLAFAWACAHPTARQQSEAERVHRF
jgi:pimeloyl-ACP methyl ester carboxylesterase